eukprot:Opistho-2@49268
MSTAPTLSTFRSLLALWDTSSSGVHASRGLTPSFSYRLSPPIVEALVKRFGAPGTGGTNVIRFDEFIVACVQLQRMTDSFRKYDTSKTGSIQLQYEQFIGLLLEASFV